ncbi:MAG: hypothetical protein M5U26_16620 [Planctomycetota bacterium]|nr:hypothetical protein [Planctomycetota bacterium]
MLAVLESLLYGQPAELFLQAAKRQPESSWAHAANARGLKASSDARLRSLRGVAARHALEAPDAHRLLPQDRAFAIVEAALDLHRLGRPVEMLQLVDREASRIGDPWLEAVTRAEVGLGAKTPGIAIEALRPRFDPLFGAIAARLREACRAGEALPDALPPARVGTEIDDPFAGAAVREILRKGLFLLARAQVQKEDHEAAFEVAATLVNLYPGYEPGRLLLAEIYRRLGQPGAAERLDAPPAQRPAGV